MTDARDVRRHDSVDHHGRWTGPQTESQTGLQAAPGRSTRTELLPESALHAGLAPTSRQRDAASQGARAADWPADESLMLAMGLGAAGGATPGPSPAIPQPQPQPQPQPGQRRAGQSSVASASPPSPIARKAAQLRFMVTTEEDGWQQAVLAALEHAEPAERVALQRLLPMPTLIDKLSAWEATRLGALGPVVEGQELLHRKRVAYFKQVLDDYPPSYAQVFLLYALQAACLDEVSQIVAELANARRLTKLRALPAVAQRLAALGVDLSVFQEPSEPWTNVLGGASRSLRRFVKDDRPGKYGSQKAELPTEYAAALHELELADFTAGLTPGNAVIGGFDEVTFGVPHGLVDLGRSTIAGAGDLARGEYDQAGEQLAGAGMIVLTHLGIKAWNVGRRAAGRAAKPGADATPAPPGSTVVRGPQGPGQFTLANFQGPITAEEAKLGAIFGLNPEAQAALGRVLSRVGRSGLEKVASLIGGQSRAALLVAEHGEAGLYALLEAEGDVSAARAKLAARAPTPQAPPPSASTASASESPARVDKPASHASSTARATGHHDEPAATWVEHLKAELTAEELAQYELMKGKWKSPEDLRGAFGGSLTAAKRDISAQVNKKIATTAAREAVNQASRRRAEEIYRFAESHGLMNDARVRKILDRVPGHPTRLHIVTAARELRSLVVADLLEAEAKLRYPQTTVLREVKLWEEQKSIAMDDFQAMPAGSKHGLTLRPGSDGRPRVYKNVTDIDAMIIEHPESRGKAKIIRIEQHKTGIHDTPSAASTQNNVAISKINDYLAKKCNIRLETSPGVDISEQLDLSSVQHAQRMTIGPAGKNFGESLGITAQDLDRLAQDLAERALEQGTSQ